MLQLEEVAKPIQKGNEVLIKVKATAENLGEVRLRKADPFAVRFFFGLTKPKVNILGAVFSGEVEFAFLCFSSVLILQNQRLPGTFEVKYRCLL